jgi:hypothetical protein
MLAELCRYCAEPISDVGGVDLDGRVQLDLFSQRRNCNREVEQSLLESLDPRDATGVGQRDLVEQPNRAVGIGELRL